MPTDPENPTRQAGKPEARGVGSWLVPGSLLALFLISGASFLATQRTRDAGRYAAPPGREPSRGGVFRFPIYASPVQTLDPARAETGSDIMLVQQIYDGLTAFDEHLNIVPALARYWEISPDGKTYTFELRSDAHFHNGRPVNAEDCVYSLQRLLAPGHNENNYHYFSRIEGAEDFRAGRASQVRGLRALDEKTFQIRFTTPFVPALSVLGMYCAKILPKKEVEAEGEGFFDAPVGTGPFRFSHWIGPDEDAAAPSYRGILQAVHLEANRDYFGGPPYLDGLTFRAVWNRRGAKPEKPVNELVDCLPGMAENYGDWVPVETEKLLAVNYLILPIKVPPYDDPRVRRALNYALDKRSFLDSNPRTAGIPAATGIVPPGIPGFVPMESSYQHNLEKARSLLVEAGYPGGKGLPPLEIAVLEKGRYGSDPYAAARRGCLIYCMSQIGVEVDLIKVTRMVRPHDPSFQDRPMIFQGLTWFADFPDPDNFLRPLFHSSSPINSTGYQNPKVDRLLDRALSVTSYSARNKLYRKIEKLILADSPIIPLDYDRIRFMLRPNVRGFSLSSMGDPYIKMNKVWLDRPTDF
ncbi:MAG: ABC transporter substrate-binding protein [Acidobacteriota bacterium]